MMGEKMDEDLKARFGPDRADWPPPHGRGDQPVTRALMAEGDDTALARAVLTRLAQPRPGILPAILPARVALASYAGLWVAMAVLGYQLMNGALGDPVLALALGEVPGWGLWQ